MQQGPIAGKPVFDSSANHEQGGNLESNQKLITNFFLLTWIWLHRTPKD
jgi:hypothetical protein